MEFADGNYLARGTQAALGETGTGKEQVAVIFKILAPGFEGKHITWFGYFTDKTADRTIESLRICGWAGSDLSDLSGIDTNEVELVIANEEYEGKTISKVRWVNRAGGVGLAAPMSPEKAKAFAAKMKGAVLRYDQANGKPKPTAPRPAPSNRGSHEPPPPSDGDMPPF